MAECVNCGNFTKFNGGFCYTCYKENEETKNVKVLKEKTKKVSRKDNPWISGVIKGRIAETIVEELFRSLGFQVFSYGMENSIPGIKDLLKGVRGDVSLNLSLPTWTDIVGEKEQDEVIMFAPWLSIIDESGLFKTNDNQIIRS